MSTLSLNDLLTAAAGPWGVVAITSSYRTPEQNRELQVVIKNSFHARSAHASHKPGLNLGEIEREVRTMIRRKRAAELNAGLPPAFFDTRLTGGRF